MVRTRQEIRTDLSSAGRGNRDIDFFEGQEESPLKDTTSHSPVVSTQAGHEESTGPQVRQVPRQTRDVRLTVSAPRERVEEPHQTTLARPSISYVDPMLLAQLVKIVMESMANAATPMPAPPLTPIIQNISEADTTTNDVVHLVRLVKSMREMGCEPYSGEQDAEVAGRWIRKVEKTMIQINIPHDLRVDFATQLLLDGAMTWWETIQLRRATKTLSWDDFKTEFENQYYSKYHRKMKEQEFLALRQEGMSVLEYER
jgi:hypothetical protein